MVVYAANMCTTRQIEVIDRERDAEKFLMDFEIWRPHNSEPPCFVVIHAEGAAMRARWVVA